MTATASTPALFRTATGQRLYIPPCPHVLGVELPPASANDLATLDVCSRCQAELDGVGRTYFDPLEPALAIFEAYRETWTAIAGMLRGAAHDQVWVPNNLSYVALGLAGKGVAWVGKTYVQLADGTFHELPGYEPGVGGGAIVDARWGDVCPTCSMQMPLTRVCDECG